MKIIKYNFSLIIACLFVVVPVFAQKSVLQKELQADPHNPILLMQQQMLTHKEGVDAPLNSGWSNRVNNLSHEVSLDVNSRRRGFSRSVDILTGKRAIDESLQLGSIGRNRNNTASSKQIPIDSIELVEIASHPWKEMVNERSVNMPNIATLVPHDMLFVHIDKPNQLLEIETILAEQAELFGDIYNLNQSVTLKAKMMQRLGVPNADALITGVEDLAFISEDVAFYPGTDYALIFKPKNTLLEKGFKWLVKDKAIYRKVGEYWVIATHESVITRIESALENSEKSMVSQLDYHYSLLSLESRRDGLIYLSEAFIRKLTSPAYRINARRRNTVINALETLQYSVFAYRRITGQWPDSLNTMVSEGYLAEKAIFEAEKYSISKNGKIHHQVWGSLWDVVPVNQVPIEMISEAEKNNYNSFSDGYQDFFREFFDPIGIAYTVSDQLLLHTLIMPLIDNSDYRGLTSWFGGTTQKHDFLFNPDRLGAVNLAVNFSIDDILLSSKLRHWRRSNEGELSDADRTRMLYEVESDLVEEITGEPLAENTRVFDFFGDEVFFGIGEKNNFSRNNIADIDVWLGVKLKDPVRAEKFFREAWRHMSESTRGGSFFSLSSADPITNEYKGKKYHLVPTGFINVFYAFFDDSFYITVSQVAMNRLIDASLEKTDKFSPRLERSFAYIGEEHNIISAIDLQKVSGFGVSQDLNFASHNIGSQLTGHKNTLNEAMVLAKILPGYDGTLNNTTSYYSHLPKKFYQSTFEAKDGQLSLQLAKSSYSFKDLESGSKYKMLEKLRGEIFEGANISERIASFRALTLGLSFIPEGLAVKLSIGNPKITESDPRFVNTPSLSSKNNNTLILAAIAACIFLFALLFMYKRKRV